MNLTTLPPQLPVSRHQKDNLEFHRKNVWIAIHEGSYSAAPHGELDLRTPNHTEPSDAVGGKRWLSPVGESSSSSWCLWSSAV